MSDAPTANGNATRWLWRVLRLIVPLLLLVMLLPYHPTSQEPRSEPAAKAFTPQFADFLQTAFEFTDLPTIKTELDGKRLDYQILPYNTKITITHFDGSISAIMVDKLAQTGVDVGYAHVLLPENLPPALAERIIDTLKNLNDFSLRQHVKPGAISEQVLRLNLDADRYVHALMLVLALVLYVLLVYGWRGRFDWRDWPLWLIVIVGLFAVYGPTDAAIADIKLHFFNENKQVWRWDVYGPAGPAWQKLLYRLFGAADVVLFRANALMGVLSAVPLYLILRDRFAGRLAGFAGAFLLVTHPIWLRYAASDIIHPLSGFLFLSSVALAVDPRLVKPRWVFVSAAALAISMLGRGELMLYTVAWLLVVGGRQLVTLFRLHARAMIWGAILIFALVLPQVISLLATIRLGGSNFVTFDWSRAVASWLWLPIDGSYNIYAKLIWSPWPHIALTLFGTIYLLKKRPLTALALMAIPPLFLWNEYFFKPVFSSTHYQVPAVMFYILAAGVGLGVILRGLYRSMGRASLFLLAIAIAAGIWTIAIGDYARLLHGPFTFMNTYRAIAENQVKADPLCKLLFFKPFGDHDLHNPGNIWRMSPREFASYHNLATDGFPGTQQCLYYLRSPGCVTADADHPQHYDQNWNSCARLESQMTLETVWMSTVAAQAACGEKYFEDEIGIGLYRVIAWRGEPVGQTLEQDEHPPADSPAAR